MKKYYNIYKDIKNKILQGEYKAGDKLPSKRMQTDKTGYSLITIERAYQMLEEEGYIYSLERKGYYVSQIEAILPNIPNADGYTISYLEEPTQHSNRDFEYSVWFKTIRKVISDNGDRLFIKSPAKGCAILRNAIAAYLLRYRGMHAQPSNIIIGSGAEQLYESVVKILGRDKIYGIEDPCYRQIHYVYENIGAKVALLAMGTDGIKTEALNNRIFDVLHVTPYHSYPSGVTTSISKRYLYLKWASKNNRYIIEDDFDSEFFIPGNSIESLYSLDTTSSVIYINTFSKSLSPAMRIGYMILPDELMDTYEQKLGVLSCSVPVLDQYILAEFISNGSFERHLNQIRRKMKK